MVIANGVGSTYNALSKIMEGRKIGTFFSMAEKTGPSVEEQADDGNRCNVETLHKLRDAVLKFTSVRYFQHSANMFMYNSSCRCIALSVVTNILRFNV